MTALVAIFFGLWCGGSGWFVSRFMDWLLVPLMIFNGLIGYHLWVYLKN